MIQLSIKVSNLPERQKKKIPSLNIVLADILDITYCIIEMKVESMGPGSKNVWASEDNQKCN